MKKELLKKFYLLQEAVRNTEGSIFNIRYFEGNGFVHFQDIRNNLDSLYKEFDSEQYSILESLDYIVGSKGYFDTTLLTDEHKKRFGSELSDTIVMDKQFYKTCKYCFIPLKTLDEALDFMQEKGWIE